MMGIMKRMTLSLAVLLTLMFQHVYAEVAVVVHPDNNAELDSVSVRKLFLGKSKSYSNGEKVQSYDLPEGNDARAIFREKVLRKSESRLNSYWARMLFSSKAKPPRVLASADEVKAMVANNIDAIGYIDANEVDASVKVVLTTE